MMEIKRMTGETVSAAAELLRGSLEEAWSEETLREQLENPNDRTYIAFEDGRAAGVICAWNVLGEIEINLVAVEPEQRRRGTGRALIRAVLAEEGIERAVLEVRESNATARRLYESEGFEPAGRRKGFYEKPEEDAMIYVLEVRC
ncbi:MAG: ribosomal protein S18-alanine N-acetyltransferase [Ruminococcus sp.]|nr:ribosomal protein S18-alanine N-acetyltransferase [Ruminococcus sp.]